MDTAATSIAEKKDREERIDQQDIFYRVGFFLAAITRGLLRRVLGADDAAFRPVMGKSCYVESALVGSPRGAGKAEENRRLPSAEECAAPAQDVIIQVDGGHIPIQEQDKRSFEALSAIVYRPESVQDVDQYHRKIMEKTCVVSALDDDLQTIKTYLLHAALKQGMTQDSKVTALADGANNCWSVLSVVAPHCQTLECILDWFHIGKKFQNVKTALGEAFEKSLESAKWKLWHGKARDALTKLAFLRDNITDEEKRSKITGLHDYIERNQLYIVNYDERDNAHKPYTSQVAESHVDALINARHKKTRKMQWTRAGAHYVLQIRAMIVSEEWDSKWQNVVLSTLRAAS